MTNLRPVASPAHITIRTGILLATLFQNFASGDPAIAYRGNILPILEDNCFDCHGDGAKKGGVSFDSYNSETELLADTDLWHRVLKNVRGGLMPPPKKDQPTAEQNQQLQAWIKADVFKLDPSHPDPGRPVLRRLNRTEYRNTIRDLTGVDFQVAEEFPADDTGHGFDNIGEVLTVSPMLLEKYLAAAKNIVRQAVPQVSRMMPQQRVEDENFYEKPSQNGPLNQDKPRDLLSYYEPMTVAATTDLANSGRYSITFELSGRERYVEGESDINRCRVRMKVDGQELGSQELTQAGGRQFSFPYDRDLTAGTHEISVELEPLTPGTKQVRSLALGIENVTLRGPLDEKFWVSPPDYSKWFPREVPGEPAARRIYAEELLGKFATRAYRRPLNDDTAQRLATLAESVWSLPGQSFESGVSRAMEAVLSSPRFLFREEFISPPEPGQTHPQVDEYSLAARLSYFLWSTLPDEELLGLAAQGKLRANLTAQVQRMLTDEKSQAFFRNFPGQWLQARNVEDIPIDARSVLIREQKPDPEVDQARDRFMELRQKKDLTKEDEEEMDRMRAVFRQKFERYKGVDFADNLRRDMRRETELYFEHIIRQDRPLTELLDSNYTFLNERLAKHYGVDGVTGDEMRLSQLPASSPRGGILTQGSVLAVTSNPTRTSPVKRGLFILDNILGTPPPPPPPDIPSLEDGDGGRSSGPEPTLRESLERHRADPKCASCHNRMDPLGLAFENFNAMGSWRDFERGKSLDTSGQLVSGEQFKGAGELKKILVSNHREAFYRCMVEKLLIYALGRGLDHLDETTVDQLVDRLNHADGRPSALLQGIVESDAFQRRRVRDKHTALNAK